MPAAIVADHVGRVYPQAPPGVAALSDVTFEIPTGRVYGLIGRNGAGKTTFIRIAATQLMPTSGTVWVLGQDVRTGERAIRSRIACVPQESRPLYFLNVEEAIYLNLRMRGMDRTEARRRTRAALEELSLEEVKRRGINRLSGGMRRRVMVAMIVATDAELVFLDEPTTGLDPLARREVWRAIDRMTREGRTTVLTTHYLDEAEALSSRLALMEKGRLLLEGPPGELRNRVRYPFRVTLKGAFTKPDLDPYGRVAVIEGGFLVFAREREARELAQLALARGADVTMAPARLEDIFLELVGRSIEEEPPVEAPEEAM